MIQDKSENYAETWKFLDRRFEDLKTFSEVKKTLNQTEQIFSSSFIVVSVICLFHNKINFKSTINFILI